MKVHVLFAVMALVAPTLCLSGCEENSTGSSAVAPTDLQKLEEMQKADAEKAAATPSNGEV